MTSSNADADLSVELLVVPGCPHEVTARAMVKTVLQELDVQAPVTTTVVDTDDHAWARGFVGSPTFLINGQDPFAEPGSAVGLACRVYRTPAGMVGVPPMSSLRAAIRTAARGVVSF